MDKINRLLLINNYEILKKLSKDHNDKYYDRCIKILECGYTKNYNELTENISDETDEYIQNFVFDVIKLYDEIYNSYNQLKDNIIKNYISSLHRFKLDGFDGNNETKYMSYFNFLLDDDNHWLTVQEFVKKFNHYPYNTHSPKINTYSELLSKSEKYLNSFGYYNCFDYNILIDILKTDFDKDEPIEIIRRRKTNKIKKKIKEDKDKKLE